MFFKILVIEVIDLFWITGEWFEMGYTSLFWLSQDHPGHGGPFLLGNPAGLKHRSQVRSQVTGQVTGQVNRKNIFLPRKLTIFNSKLTRYEKESVIMRGIVYFKLQDVALRD